MEGQLGLSELSVISWVSVKRGSTGYIIHELVDEEKWKKERESLHSRGIKPKVPGLSWECSITTTTGQTPALKQVNMENPSGLTQNQVLEIAWIVQIWNTYIPYEHVVRNFKFLIVQQLLKCKYPPMLGGGGTNLTFVR